MRKRTVKLWRLHDDGRKLYAGTIEDIEAWLDGKPINVINPEALKKG